MTAQKTHSSSVSEATITIFPPLPGMGCGCGSCSCGSPATPAASAADQLKEFLDRLRSLQDQGGSQDDSSFQTEMMQYDSIPAVRSAMMRLIVFTNTFPDPGQLIEQMKVAVS